MWRCAESEVNLIEEGYFRQSIDKNGRYHTNLTNLDRRVRPFLKIDGQVLMGIDIRNSQLVFLVVLLREIYTFSTLKQVSKTTHKHNNNTHTTNSNDSCYNSVSSTTLYQGFSENLEIFFKLVEQGQLYEHFMFRSNTKKPRDKFKRQVLATFYDEWRDHERRSKRTKKWYSLPLLEIIKEDFPDVYEMCNEIKRQYGYEGLANKMQKMEADFIINTCCKRIIEERPDIPLVTIHDSIHTTPEHIEYVERVVREEFAKLNINPQINQA